VTEGAACPGRLTSLSTRSAPAADRTAPARPASRSWGVWWRTAIRAAHHTASHRGTPVLPPHRTCASGRGVAAKRLYKEGSDIRPGQRLFSPSDPAAAARALESPRPRSRRRRRNATTLRIAAARRVRLIASGPGVSLLGGKNSRFRQWTLITPMPRTAPAAASGAGQGVRGQRALKLELREPSPSRAPGRGLLSRHVVELLSAKHPTALTTWTDRSDHTSTSSKAAVGYRAVYSVTIAGSVTVGVFGRSSPSLSRPARASSHAGTLDLPRFNVDPPP